MSILLAYVSIGVIVGCIEFYLFIRSRFLIQCLSFGICIVGILSVWVTLNSALSVDESLFATTLLLFALSFGVLFLLFCKLLKTQTKEKYPIRILDILLGYHRFLEEYYSSRRSEFEKDTKFNDIQTKEISLNQRELVLNKLTEDNKRILNEIKSASTDTNSISFPVQHVEPLSRDFIVQFPELVGRYSTFVSHLHSLNEDFISCKDEEVTSDEYRYVRAYFYGICTYIVTVLFEAAFSKDVRAHVRFLRNNQYLKLVSSLGDSNFEEQSDVRLTEIPADKGMIFEAYKTKRSLIKSYNSELHHPSKNDHIWKEYITIPIIGVFKDDVQYLSIGISFKFPEKHKNMTKFTNFVMVEEFLKENVSQFNKVCNIMEIIDNNYKEAI